MHIRRLVKAGQTSHTVSLPKEWLDINELKKGDIVYIEEASDQELVIRPKAVAGKAEKKEITITIDGKTVGSIQREVTSAYVNNYNVINLIGKDLNKKNKDIREIIHDFVALEIAEQTSSKIVAKDLLNLEEISIDGTVRRMDMILRSIFTDSIKSLEGEDVGDSIFFRDADVNRLYFLMYRLLKSALKDKKVAANLGIGSDRLLSVWYLIINLEHMADDGKNITDIFSKLNKKEDKKKISEIYSLIEGTYLDVMKAYYGMKKDMAEDVAKRRIEIFDMCNKYRDFCPSMQAAELVENFKDLSTRVTNVARIVLDHE